MTKYVLVDDVGGTNARLTLRDIASGKIPQIKAYSGLDYPSLEVVIRVCFEEHKVEVKDGCIAVAYSVTGDWVTAINHTWTFSTAEMKKNLGFNHLEVINNFTIVSMAIPMLRKEHLIQFGDAESVEDKPITVYGAGTRLRAAHLVHVDKRWVGLSGEGDRVDFAPSSEGKGIILEILHAGTDHVSVERVPSGPGLVNLYRAIVKADNRLPENLKPKDITERVLADSYTDCRRALSLFCIIMDRFDDNLALNLGASGGVSIAGGIMPRFLEFFRASSFHAAPEDKGCSKECAHNIPVYLIVHDDPGLLGSSAHLRQTLGHILQTLLVMSGGSPPDNLLNHTVN